METENYEVYNDPAFKRFVRSIGKASFTTVQEEQALYLQLKSPGVLRDRAAQRLVESHMRLVVAVAANFIGRGISIQDLVQDGVLGLYDALDKFEPSKGRFKTYAGWWVRMRISESLKNLARTVRLPAPVLAKLSRLKKLQDDYARRGVMPTSAQLAEALGIDQKRLSQLEMSALGTTSLDAPVDAEGELTLSDVIADESLEEAGTELDRQAIIDALYEALDGLNEREKDIVMRRFGLIGDGEQTLEQVGNAYGITRERIRQIEAKAVSKLRTAQNSRLVQLLQR